VQLWALWLALRWHTLRAAHPSLRALLEQLQPVAQLVR
jgi:hypothetical protein